jgi:hypothetical protein
MSPDVVVGDASITVPPWDVWSPKRMNAPGMGCSGEVADREWSDIAYRSGLIVEGLEAEQELASELETVILAIAHCCPE